MERTKVNSSNIESIGHDSSTNTLEVKFKSGKTYNYFNVNFEKYSSLVNAKSIGQHFHQNIKDKHETMEVR